MRKYVTAALVGTTLLIGGCNSPTGETGVVVEPAPVVFVPSWVFTSQNRRNLPYPNDIWFGNSTDGTLNIPGTLSSTGAAGVNLPSVNLIDGYSINATMSVPFTSPVDITTVKPYMPVNLAGTPLYGAETNFWVLNTATGTPLFPLIPPIPGVFPGNEAIAQYTVQVSAATNSDGKVLEIVPLKPLDPDTTYAIFITAGVADLDGNSLQSDIQFGTVRDGCLTGETLSNRILEASKAAVCPLMDAAVGLLGLPSQAVMVAWSVSTQSISDSLDVINETATAQVAGIQFTGFKTSDVLPVPGVADIYAGFIELPYYLDANDPYGKGWKGAGGTNLTRLNPVPVPTATLRVPVLLTVPNAGSGKTKPAEGWPVVVYQHGVTSDRSTMLAMADSFAATQPGLDGFAVIAIDLPLHGLSAGNPLFFAPGNPAGVMERNFYLDLFDNATFAPVPDGVTDSGAQIFAVGLQNPLLARDFMREVAADLISLVRTIPTMDFQSAAGPTPDGTPDLDGSRIHFVGISLGSITGTPFLGVNNEIATASLSSPAGTWTDLLTDPESLVFGAPLLAGFSAASGLAPGTLGFDEFLRDWQQVLDPGDPLSYAVKAAANSPMHGMEILNDVTVPNAPTENAVKVMGLSTVTNGLTTDVTGIRGIVRFTDGGHGSLLDPSSVIENPPGSGTIVQGPNGLVTVEMQTQAVSFALSNGVQLAVGTSGCDCVQ